MRQQTPSVGQVVPPNVTSRISASLIMSQESHHWQSLLTASDQSQGPHLKRLGQLPQRESSAGEGPVEHGPELHKIPRRPTLMEQCHDIGEEQRQGIGVGAAIRCTMW